MYMYIVYTVQLCTVDSHFDGIRSKKSQEFFGSQYETCNILRTKEGTSGTRLDLKKDY